MKGIVSFSCKKESVDAFLSVVFSLGDLIGAFRSLIQTVDLSDALVVTDFVLSGARDVHFRSHVTKQGRQPLSLALLYRRMFLMLSNAYQ